MGDKEYPLKTARIKKTFHVAKFLNSKVNFGEWSKPVHMYRDVNNVSFKESLLKLFLHTTHLQRKSAGTSTGGGSVVPHTKMAYNNKKMPWVLEDANVSVFIKCCKEN